MAQRDLQPSWATSSSVAAGGEPANTVPSEGSNVALTLFEGATETITSALLDFDDAEQPDDEITYTLTSAATNGALRLAGLDLGVNQTFTQADINAGLVTYKHDDSQTRKAAFGFTVSDGAGGTVTGQTFSIIVYSINDPPLLTASPGTSFAVEVANGSNLPAAVDPGISVSDPDNATLRSVTVQVTSGYAGQIIIAFTNDDPASYGDIQVSSPGGPGSAITLWSAGSSSLTQWETALRAVTFTTNSDQPSTEERTVTFLATDGTNFSNSVTKQINITSNNDLPTQEVNAGLALAEGATATLTASMLAFDDAEQADGALTYKVVTAATNGTLRRGGAVLGVNGTFTQADVNSGLVTYTHDGSETTTASFGFSVSDGVGGTVTGQTFSITVTAVNDLPTQGTNAGLVLNEGAAATITSALLDYNDAEQSDSAISFTVTGTTANGALKLHGVTLAVSDTFTQGDVNGGFLSYAHDGSETSRAAFTFSVSDSYASLAGQNFSITVNAVDDTGTAADDAKSIEETTATAGNVLANDADPDGTRVTAVNGVAADVGLNVELASGAVLKLNADGSYRYDPNGAFDGLGQAGLGASNDRATDSFQYTIAGGSVATVTITITGLYSSPHRLEGTNGNDRINGTGQSDIFVASAGADTMIGAGGNDSYAIDNAGDVIVETATTGSVDVAQSSISYALPAGARVEVLKTTNDWGTASIHLTGNEYSNNLVGNSGANRLDGKGAADTMAGGVGNDTYVVDNGQDDIVETAESGSLDTVEATVSYALDPGVRVERLKAADAAGTSAINLGGNEYANSLAGNAGANILDGKGGGDTMSGFGGNDSYFIDSPADKIVETATSGSIDVARTSATYTLGAGVRVETLRTTNDQGLLSIALTGNEFANTLIGNAGSNILDGKGGADTMSGGSANDIYVVDNAADRVTETLETGSTFDTVRSSTSYTLGKGVRVEALVTTLVTGTTGINLTGNEFSNEITGNAGVNVLKGAAGDDTLLGEGGGDMLDGGAGNDIMTGGAGNDVYLVDTVGDQVSETSASDGSDRVSSTVTYTLGSHVEKLSLTGASSIGGTGNSLANAISGNAAANILGGLGGNDTLSGAGGADRMYGGTGADRLYSGSGNDVMRGDDTEADRGADRFYFDTAPNSSSNKDRIDDFNPADDFIHLARSVFTQAGAAGTLSRDAFYTIGVGAADREDRIIYSQVSGALFYDPDGTGSAAAIQFATVTPGLVLSYTDFIVY